MEECANGKNADGESDGRLQPKLLFMSGKMTEMVREKREKKKKKQHSGDMFHTFIRPSGFITASLSCVGQLFVLLQSLSCVCITNGKTAFSGWKQADRMFYAGFFSLLFFYLRCDGRFCSVSQGTRLQLQYAHHH